MGIHLGLVYNSMMTGNALSLFGGRNMITYNPAQFQREEALSLFIQVKREFLKRIERCDSLQMDLNREYSGNRFGIRDHGPSGSGASIGFMLNGSTARIEEDKFDLPSPPDLRRRIETVKLTTPFLRSDKRWESVGLTSSPLFLGSVLIDHGFKVDLDNLSLPVSEEQGVSWHADIRGFTLFEDIFTGFREFLDHFPPAPETRTAAGGPFVTLSPLGAVYHLPEINLFIRGEAELIFPEILNALRKGDIRRLMSYQGFYYQDRGTILVSDYNEINRVNELGKLYFNFSHAGKKELSNGLEMNFSRGCGNHCIFCSNIQGKKLRKLPLGNIEQLISGFKDRLNELNLDPAQSGVININDDDILQDIDYAGDVLNLIKTNSLSIWGIQSSITSFFHHLKSIKEKAVKLISDNTVYRNPEPILWIGTDTFLSSRSSRLGKPLPEKSLFLELLAGFEEYGINHYHYWISSDHMSSWGEFIQELIGIHDLMTKFPRFGILPHAPFLIPYPSTPSYKLICRSPDYKNRIRYKSVLKGIDPIFDLNLVDHAETGWEYLNKLLRNEKKSGKKGFFDYLKNGDISEALICAYNFLKEERISGEGFMDRTGRNHLAEAESRLEDYIIKLV